MKESSMAYQKVMSRGGKSIGRKKYYVNVMNETDKEMMGVHLNKLEYEIVKDNTNEDKKMNLKKLMTVEWRMDLHV